MHSCRCCRTTNAECSRLYFHLLVSHVQAYPPERVGPHLYTNEPAKDTADSLVRWHVDSGGAMMVTCVKLAMLLA